jgi:thiosulfate/3-mercaptopyruvate sulfurtransferase
MAHVSAVTLLIVAALWTGAAGAQTPEPSGYAHPEWFADAAWLQEHIDDAGLAIVALTPPDNFEAGHIPGAAQVDWPELEIVETGDQSVQTWRGEIEQLLTQLAVERSDTVVVYDGGTFYAARLWWILYQLGHDDVRILNGGIGAWADGSGELEAGASTAEPAPEPYQGGPSEQAIAQIDEVIAAFEQGDTAFVDARSGQEYAEGQIPGAVNVPFIDNAEAEGPKYWKSAEDLRVMYEALGVTPDKPAIAYCSTGVRSAATFFTLLQLGFENVSLFTGSWVEWTSDPDRPIATGDQP